MRILQVHTRYRERGGEDAVVDGERELLTLAGHYVELVEFYNPSRPVGAARRLLTAPWNSSAARTVTEAAMAFRADVVHIHNTWFAASPSIFSAVSRGRIATVATMHNYRLSCVNAGLYRDGHVCEDCVGHLPWRGVVHRCYRSSAAQSGVVAVTIGTHRALRTWEEHVDVVVALTPFMAERLRLAGVPKDSIAVKPNVVEDPGVRATPPSESDMILFVGRLSHEKGVEDLFDAWSKEARTDRRLVVIGDGPLSGWAKEVAQHLPNIDLRGSMDRSAVAAAMKQARALVLPTRLFEGMPMVLLEAAAAGLPTVVPDHAALPSIVADGGIAYRSGSVLDLARRLQELDDDAVVDRLGSSARVNYEMRFSPSVGLQSLEQLYESALQRRSTGR